MRRRFPIRVSVACLLLAGCAGVWARSYWVGDLVRHESLTHWLWIQPVRGTVYLGSGNDFAGYRPVIAGGWSYDPCSTPWCQTQLEEWSRWRFAGFVYGRPSDEFTHPYGHFVGVPLWLLALLLGIWVVMEHRRWSRRRAQARGFPVELCRSRGRADA